MSEVVYRGTLASRAGASLRSAPGLAAGLCAVVVATGATDANVRRDFGAVLVVAALLVPIFAALWAWLRRRGSVPLEIGTDRDGSYVRIGDAPAMRGPFRVERGVFSERLEGGLVSGTVAVLFVVVEAVDGRRLGVRKALGAAFRAPDDWPRVAVPRELPYTHLDVERLPAALARAGVASS